MADVRAADTSQAGEAPRWPAVLAWALGALGVAEALGILLVSSSLGSVGDELGLFFLISLIAICAYSLVGAAIAAQRPRHYAGWTLMVGGILFGLALLTYSYGAAMLQQTAPTAAAVIALWLGDWLFLPALDGVGTLFLLHFPSGHLPGPRWVWVRRGTYLAIVLFIAGEAFHPGDISPDDQPGVSNPFGAPASLTSLFEAIALGGNVAMALLTPFVALALVQRYRVADDTVRHQIKWIAYVGAGIAVAGPIAALQVGVLSEWAWLATLTFIALVPVAVAFAVLRYRLYDIDRLISRTLVYGGLTAILAGLYTASIRLFNGIFVAATGQESEAALVITTLILATTLTPLRRWLEGVVEGRRAGASVAAESTTAPSSDPFSDPAFEQRVSRIVERSVDEALKTRSNAVRGRTRR